MKGVNFAKDLQQDNQKENLSGSYAIIHNLQNIYLQNANVDSNLLQSILNLNLKSRTEKSPNSSCNHTPRKDEKPHMKELKKKYFDLQRLCLEQQEEIERLKIEKENEFRLFQNILNEAKRLEKLKCERQVINEPKPNFSKQLIQRKRSDTIRNARLSLPNIQFDLEPDKKAENQKQEEWPEYLSSSEKAFLSKLDPSSQDKVLEMLHRQQFQRKSAQFESEISKVKKLEVSLKEREKILNEKQLFLLKLEERRNRKGKKSRKDDSFQFNLEDYNSK